jgi:Uma2 family endonuclease
MSIYSKQGPHHRLHRFTVREYHRMGEVGILHEDERVELIDGEIVEMTPIGSPHAACVDRLNRLFSSALADRAQVRVQSPVRLDDANEVQPDISLLRMKATSYADAHPGPDDVLLVVEVADTSLEFDRTTKLSLYARFGIQEVWLVNLPDSCVEVHRRPTGKTYRTRALHSEGESCQPEAFTDVSLRVDDIIPPRQVAGGVG